MKRIDLKSKIRSIPDFPKKGVIFRDITPVLQDPKAFRFLIEELIKPYKNKKIDKVVGIDARGFLLASPIALKLGAGLCIVRKKGKLPYQTVAQNYSLEYGEETIEMHKDSILKGERVLIVDDVIATGGTLKATASLVEKLGGKIVGIAVFVELKDLKGRQKLKKYPLYSLIKF
jgi:adenine phosphoribosyltransferase